MSLATRCGWEFSPSTKAKGGQYFRDGKVSLVETDARYVGANVQGSRRPPYEVSLDWEGFGRAVLVSCSCPHFDSGDFCKHIWATILAADEAQITASIPGKGDVQLFGHDGSGIDADFIDDESDDDDWFFEDEFLDGDDDGHPAPIHFFESAQAHKGVAPATIARVNDRRKQSRRNGRPTDWKQLLAAVDSLDRPESLDELWRHVERRDHRIHYFVDLERSVAVGTLAVRLYEQETRKDGTWGKIKAMRPRLRSTPDLSEDDRKLIHFLAGNKVLDDTHGWHSVPYRWD